MGPPGQRQNDSGTIDGPVLRAHFLTFSAVTAGVKDIREVVAQSRNQTGDTILFVDEVHRFNKAQQDAFLPHVEDGTIILIGATTENPSFELNNALLSRLRVYVLSLLMTKIFASCLTAPWLIQSLLWGTEPFVLKSKFAIFLLLQRMEMLAGFSIFSKWRSS